MRYRKSVLLLFLLAILAAVGTVRGQDELVADLGFRPAENGFGFANYTDGYEGLTPFEVERLFGSVVCRGQANDSGDGCTLTSPAELWMEDNNQMMINGHCEGMASLSLALYQNLEDPAAFGGTQTNELSLDDSPDLQREIALWWSTWGNPPTVTNFDVPSAIVNTLIETMNNHSETFSLDFYMPDWTGGHAITPYAVADQGNGIMWIMVYDNNWPGEERHVEVDMNNETWQYAAAINPDDVENLYYGSAETRTMGLTPISSRLDQHQCPFCGDADSSAVGNYVGVVVNGAGAQSTVTDSQGNVTGLVNGKFVNTIPGARVQHLVGGLVKNQMPAIVYVPSGTKFRVAVSGDKSSSGGKASISFIRTGVITRVSNINLDDQPDFIDFDGNQMRYTSGDGGETPTIEQGMTTSGDDYHYEIQGKAAMGADGTLDFSVDPATGEFNIGGSEANEYSVNVDRIDETGKDENFYTDNLDIPAGEDAKLDAGQWQDGQDITGEIVNPDGSVEGQINLSDEVQPTEPADQQTTDQQSPDQQPTEEGQSSG